MNIGMKRGGLIALLLAVMLLVSMFAAVPAQAKGEAAVIGAAPKTAEVSQNDAAGDAPEAAPAGKNQVEAATVDELLKAIAPNTVITLTGRSYDLTRAQGYGVYGSKWYGWNDIYDDGWELEIDNVEGLTIRASRPGTEIITVPRYACVMKFVNCADVTLEGFTAGHSDGPGFCTGAVLYVRFPLRSVRLRHLRPGAGALPGGTCGGQHHPRLQLRRDLRRQLPGCASGRLLGLRDRGR